MKTNYRVRDLMLAYEWVYVDSMPSIKTIESVFRSYAARFGFRFYPGSIVLGDGFCEYIFEHCTLRRVYTSKVTLRFLRVSTKTWGIERTVAPSVRMRY